MSFLVFIVSCIAGIIFFAPSIASLFHGAAIHEDFLKISKETDDTELINTLTKLKRNNYLYALFGAGMTVLALILAFGTLEKYMVAILPGYFLIPTIIYFFSVSEYKLNTTNTALETIRNSKTGKATREDIFNLIKEETQLCDSGVSDLPTHTKKMAEITTLLSDGKFLFSAEEKAQIESELEALKKRIAIVTHPENPENIAKERTINVIQKENDMKKNKTKIKNFAFDDYKETPYVNPIGTVIDDNSFSTAAYWLYFDFLIKKPEEINKQTESIFKLMAECFNLLNSFDDDVDDEAKEKIIQKSLAIIDDVEKRKPLDVDCTIYSKDDKYFKWLQDYSFANYAHALLLAYFNKTVEAVYYYLKGFKAQGFGSRSLFHDYMTYLTNKIPAFADGEYFRTDIAGFSEENPIGEEYGNMNNFDMLEIAINYLEFTNGDTIAATVSKHGKIGFLTRTGSAPSTNEKFPRPVDMYDTFVITSDFKVKKARLFVYEYSTYTQTNGIYINEGYRLTIDPRRIIQRRTLL